MTCINNVSRRAAFVLLISVLIAGYGRPGTAWVASPSDYPDIKLFSGQSQGARVTVDPTNPNRLAVGIASATTCSVKSSSDGGKSWGSAVLLPQLPGATCWYSAPALAYTADGRRLVAAYAYYRDYTHGVAFTSSTDDGATWSPPSRVNSIAEGEYYYDPEVVTAPDDDWIYVVVNCDCHFGTNVYFTRSNDLGLHWTPNNFIAAGQGSEISISRATVAAGRHGSILISYAANRYLRPNTVEIARSTNYGVSFTGGVIDTDRQLSFGRPSAVIGKAGTAHVVYLRGVYSTESHAILYKYSLHPYAAWSATPARVDDSVPQATLRSPRLAVGICEETSILHVTWVQSLNGTEQILYARKVAQPGYGWSRPLPVSSTSRVFETIDLAANAGNAFSVFSYWWQSPVFGSRIRSGVTCR